MPWGKDPSVVVAGALRAASFRRPFEGSRSVDGAFGLGFDNFSTSSASPVAPSGTGAGGGGSGIGGGASGGAGGASDGGGVTRRIRPPIETIRR
jgi:hypothetical protein